MSLKGRLRRICHERGGVEGEKETQECLKRGEKIKGDQSGCELFCSRGRRTTRLKNKKTE